MAGICRKVEIVEKVPNFKISIGNEWGKNGIKMEKTKKVQKVETPKVIAIKILNLDTFQSWNDKNRTNWRGVET